MVQGPAGSNRRQDPSIVAGVRTATRGEDLLANACLASPL